jgi:putative hydrolase of the HAD superfamily
MLDLDGTLLDHESASRDAFSEICSQWLPRLDREHRSKALETWRALEKKYMQRYLDGHLSFQEQRRGRVRELLACHAERPINQPDSYFDALFYEYPCLYEASWRPFRDVSPGMKYLWNVPGGVVVLSNGDRAQQRAKVRALRLVPEPTLFVPEDTGAAKPDPASFLNACRRMGWDPANVLYIGDNLMSDAVAAMRAGLMGCWLARTSSPDAHSADGVVRISGLLELKDIIEWQ